MKIKSKSKLKEGVVMDQQEVERSIQEIWALFRETDKKFEEIDTRFKEIGRKFAQVSREVSRAVGSLTGEWGWFVEGLIAPGAVTMFKERGIEMDKIFQMVNSHRDGDHIQIDILGVGEEYAVLIEARSKLSVEDVQEHIERMKAFKRFSPEYSDRKVVGAAAGIVIDENVDKFAYRQGFFVIGQTGDTVKILNDEGFKPKAW